MSYYRNKRHDCIHCRSSIESAVYNYSTQNYGYPLCRKCQGWFQNLISYSTATEESVNLYFALKKLDVPAIIEANDGFKTVDISVPDAKVHIEVDGKHHAHNARQALQDLKRTFHSLREGYFTLRIPNALVKHNLEEAANWVTEFLIEHRDRNKAPVKPQQSKSRHIGYCIRCQDKLNFSPDKPYCYDCYSSWVQYENYNYKENICHCCGSPSRTSMSKPICNNCIAN